MKYLGVDFGLKRIGLALSDGELSSPWKVLEVRNIDDAVEKLQLEVQRENIEKIVLGKPDGHIGKIVDKIQRALQKRGLDVIMKDETLSTKRAISRMIELNVSKKNRRINDAYSAAEILQDYLDGM